MKKRSLYLFIYLFNCKASTFILSYPGLGSVNTYPGNMVTLNVIGSGSADGTVHPAQGGIARETVKYKWRIYLEEVSTGAITDINQNFFDTWESSNGNWYYIPWTSSIQNLDFKIPCN